METVECGDCGWITDVDDLDENKPVVCPQCGGELQNAYDKTDYPK